MNIRKGILYVFVANLINLLINLISGFVLPKFLSIETYANIKLFQLYITYIGIAHLGYSDGMYIKVGGKSFEELNLTSIKEDFKTFKLFQLIISIFIIIISLLSKNEMLFFCSIIILPINVSNYIRQLYSATGQFKKYSRYTNINTVFIFIINLILLFVIKSDNYAVYITAQIIVYFLYWIFIELETRKIFKHNIAKLNISCLLENIQTGFLLMIGNFCNVIFTSIDRIFVKTIIGLIEFAYYSFATSIESLMNVFITPISTVMYNYFCNNKDKKSVKRVKNYIMIFSSIIVILIFPTKFFIALWIPKYTDSLSVLFFLISAQYTSIMIRTVHMNLYKAKRLQNRYFRIMIIMVIFSAIFNIVGIVINPSINSIAIATMITNIIWYIIGEFDFKEYKLSIKEYLYTFVILITFLLCGIMLDAIMGLIIYIAVLSLMIIIFEKNVVTQIYNNIFDFIKIRVKDIKTKA